MVGAGFGWCVVLPSWGLLAVPGDRAGWGCSSAGRAPALQAGGQRFDPAQLHHTFDLTLSRLCRCAPDGPARCGRRPCGLRGELAKSWRSYWLLANGCCPLSSEEIKVCITRMSAACSAKIVKRRLIWRLPGMGFAHVRALS